MPFLLDLLRPPLTPIYQHNNKDYFTPIFLNFFNCPNSGTSSSYDIINNNNLFTLGKIPFYQLPLSV